jgi:hypothetical protein
LSLNGMSRYSQQTRRELMVGSSKQDIEEGGGDEFAICRLHLFPADICGDLFPSIP